MRPRNRVNAALIRQIVPERYRPVGYLTSLVRQRTDRKVRLGPFAGMRYVSNAIGSAYIPKLLGIYERELAGVVEEVCQRGAGLIVDIGAAEGYYAVGLALRNPQARVIAFEAEEAGRAALREMAILNGVIARLEIRNRCGPPDLQSVLSGGQNPIIVCDVEGDEECLLDPVSVPALRDAFILAEMHDFIQPGISNAIRSRFVSTHRCKHIWQEPRTGADFPFRTLRTILLPGSYLNWAVSEW